MAFSERIVKHRSVFEVKPISHNPPGIKDFEIIKPISKGAFGQVFLARRKDSDKIYALKTMKKSDVLNKNMMEQVVVERDALAISSKSSFVAQLYYSFQNKENIFLVMEYMIGGDLKSLLHNVGFFEEEMAKFYIAELTLALEYLHNHSIFHCDIKPDNMLLSSKGHVKLTDFGLSTLSATNKPTAYDLVKHNTPYRRLSQDHMKPANIYWRTPGQLQSLVCKFTFSSPKPDLKIEKKRFTKFNNSLQRNVEFEFSSPRLTYNTTPCGFQRQIKRTSNSAVFEHEPSKLLFSAMEKEELSIKSRKRTNTFSQKDKENTPKRYRTSLPVELETAIEQPNGLEKNSIFSNSTDLELSFSHHSDVESFVENMSVDATVLDENCNKTEHDNLSGVSLLPESEASLMSISFASECNPNNTYPVPVQERRKSMLKETVRWSENSPQVLGKTQNDEVRFKTPVKTLKFQLDEEEDEVEEDVSSKSYCSTVSDESINLGNTDSTLHDTPCEVFNMPFRNQTPFRTPKSCVRGKVALTEKKRIQGTPDYLAPEILLKHEFGAPADWWALGVCYYEFVTGVPPFNDDTPDLVFKHILAHEMIWPEDEESLNESTVEVIEWMLSPDPADRPLAAEIKQLSSFCNIKWDNLQNEPAPFIPQPENIYDTTYFDAKNEARQFKMSDFVIDL